MSITDELREWAKKLTHWWYDPVKDEYTYTTGTMPPSIDAIRLDSNIIAIADRIDAEHERQLDVLYRDMSDAEWVRLPKDADGVPIHVGDELCNYTLSGYPYPNGGVYCKAIVNERMVLVGQKESSFKDLLMWEARWCRHHHAPTVEDVLTEFTDAVLEWAGKSGTVAEVGTWSDVAAQYVAKLRLAETEDA